MTLEAQGELCTAHIVVAPTQRSRIPVPWQTALDDGGNVTAAG